MYRSTPAQFKALAHPFRRRLLFALGQQRATIGVPDLGDALLGEAPQRHPVVAVGVMTGLYPDRCRRTGALLDERGRAR